MSHKEVILNKIAESDVQMTADIKKEISELVQGTAMQALLKELLGISDSLAYTLLVADLTTDKGVKQSIMYQAKAQVYSEVVEHIASIYEEVKLKQEENNNE